MPVQTLFEYLEAGGTLEEFLEGFPTVSRALAAEALEEAKLTSASRPGLRNKPAVYRVPIRSNK